MITVITTTKSCFPNIITISFCDIIIDKQILLIAIHSPKYKLNHTVSLSSYVFYSLDILRLITLKFRGANWKSTHVVWNTMKFGKRTCSLDFDQQMFKSLKKVPVKKLINFALQKLWGEWVQAFSATVSGIVYKRYLWLVTQTIPEITALQSNLQSLYPFSPWVSEKGNCPRS